MKLPFSKDKNKKINEALPENLTPEELAEKKRRNKKTVRNVVVIVVLALFALFFLSFRNIAYTYYYAFVLRDSNIDTALANIDPLYFTTDEEAEKAKFLSSWDSYSNSRLCDRVTITANDGILLSGSLYNNESDITVVVLHAYNGSSEDEFLYAAYFEEVLGEYNLLLPDSRDHGESEGEACGFGVLEQYDLECWLNWLDTELGPQTVILYGEDLGAVTALMASENGLLSDNVAFLIADSPYSSLKTLATHLFWKWYKIPSILTDVTGWVLNRADIGYTVSDVNLLSNAENGTLPVIFLVGEENTYIPPDESTAVYDAWKGDKELLSLTSRNGLIYAENADEIQAVLNSWIDKYIK